MFYANLLTIKYFLKLMTKESILKSLCKPMMMSVSIESIKIIFLKFTKYKAYYQ